MAHFQAGDRICNRKGGPTYKVRNVLEDGRVLVNNNNGRAKLLTRPGDFVRIAELDQTRSSPSLAVLTEASVPPRP
jgi:hypothetical protein